MADLTFHLDGVVKTKDESQSFDGPLALILILLSKNKIEIRDIQISLILDQYLAWLSMMEELDLDIASEFVQMASHLVYIKAKTMLAGEQEVTELEQLISSLESLKCKDAYMAIKEIIPVFATSTAHGMRLFTKPPEPGKYPEYSHSGEELFLAMGALLLREGKTPEPEEEVPHVPRRIIYGVREKSRQIIDLLRRRGEAALSSLFAMSESRSELVATFISVLELCGMGSLQLARDGDEILVSFTGGDVEEILDAIGESQNAAEGA